MARPWVAPDVPDLEIEKPMSTDKTTALSAELWSAIKSARDVAASRRREAEADEVRLNELLVRMRAAGMADHLPSLDDVIAAWSLRITEVTDDAD